MMPEAAFPLLYFLPSNAKSLCRVPGRQPLGTMKDDAGPQESRWPSSLRVNHALKRPPFGRGQG